MAYRILAQVDRWLLQEAFERYGQAILRTSRSVTAESSTWGGIGACSF